MYSRNYPFQQKQNRKQIFNSQVHSVNLKDSVSTRQFTQAKSNDNLHLLKLESKALDLLRKIEHQKFQIYTLTEQTEKLMRNCDDQKSYLRTVNVDMMRQEYEEEVKLLTEERDKLMNLVMSIKEEKAIWHNEKHEKIASARYDNQLLSEKIEKALLQKQQLLKMASVNKVLKEQYQKKIVEQQEKIDQLRHVQRKVVISLKELQQLKQKQNQF